jgi:cytochrome c oxidase subunit 2
MDQDPLARPRPTRPCGQQLVSSLPGHHSIDGTPKIGRPGKVESDVPLADGATVTADHEYLVESIVDPNLHIVAGYSPNVMPPFADTLDQTQVESIATYIETLK